MLIQVCANEYVLSIHTQYSHIFTSVNLSGKKYLKFRYHQTAAGTQGDALDDMPSALRGAVFQAMGIKVSAEPEAYILLRHLD